MTVSSPIASSAASSLRSTPLGTPTSRPTTPTGIRPKRDIGMAPTAAARTAATPHTFGLQDALRNRWAAVEGLLVSSEVFLWRAPTMFLPRLAPYCTTPALRGALVGACAASWLVLIPIVGLLSVQVRNRWQASIFEQRSDQFIDRLHGRPDLYPRGRDLKTAVAGELADEGTYLAQQYTQFLTMSMSCAAQMAAVSMQAASIPFGWPLAAALAGVAIIAYMSRNVGAESIDGQTAAVRALRLKLANAGLGAWDNVVLDNELNRDRWDQEYRDITQHYYKEAGRGRIGAQLQTVLFSLQWMLQSSLSASTALYSTCFPDKGPLLTTSQNASLVNLASLLSVAVQLSPLRRQYKDLVEKRARSEKHMRDICEEISFEDKRKPKEIHIESPSTKGTAEEYDKDLERFAEVGLHTIRGANGSGKSLMLLAAKRYLRDRAIYIPAKHDLNFPTQAGSSGQLVDQQFAHLDELHDSKKLAHVILLDEWDANLDAEMRSKLQKTIEKWSQQHAVVQIVHR